MYGLIHRAARQMTLAGLGQEGWLRILERCGLQEGDFLSGRLYADEMTFGLVGAIVDETGVPAPQLLKSFGRYWIEFIEGSAYSPMLDMAGDDLLSCLANLDRMHATIKVGLPDAKLPSFSVEELSPDHLRVVYRSDRAGLETFVEGLLEGLMRRFDYDGDITTGAAVGGVLFEVRRRSRLAA
jgi:hypothetical protein